MIQIIRVLLSFIMVALLLVACGDDDSSSLPPDKSSTREMNEKNTGKVEEMPGETAGDATDTRPVYIENGVIYQEEIYENWPYTEAPETGAMQASEVTTVADSASGNSTGKQQGMAGKIHVINAEARVFNPDILYIEPGDTVSWNNMTSHNTVSVEGMIPEGADPWRGALGENLKITPGVEGIYAYVCEPHIGFGMVGLIIAGHPTTLDEVKKFAQENLQGPYRRLLGKLIKVNL